MGCFGKSLFTIVPCPKGDEKRFGERYIHLNFPGPLSSELRSLWRKSRDWLPLKGTSSPWACQDSRLCLPRRKEMLQVESFLLDHLGFFSRVVAISGHCSVRCLCKDHGLAACLPGASAFTGFKTSFPKRWFVDP